MKENKEVQLEESVVVLSTTAIVLYILRWMIMLITWSVSKSTIKKNSILDREYTEKMRKVLKDNSVEVYKYNTKEPNAFNMGENKLYYTAPLRTVLTTEGQLIAVLAHEYGHFEGRHMQSTLKWDTFLGFAGYSFLIVLLGAVPPIGVIIAAVLMEGMFISPILLHLRRGHEYYADSYAAKIGYKKELIDALRIFDVYVRSKVCKGLSERECDGVMKQMASVDEHPEFKDRVKNILNTKALKMLLSMGNLGAVKTYIFGMMIKIKNKAVESATIKQSTFMDRYNENSTYEELESILFEDRSPNEEPIFDTGGGAQGTTSPSGFPIDGKDIEYKIPVANKDEMQDYIDDAINLGAEIPKDTIKDHDGTIGDSTYLKAFATPNKDKFKGYIEKSQEYVGKPDVSNLHGLDAMFDESNSDKALEL